MSHPTAQPLSDLYEADETAWLEAMADLVRRRDLASLDLEHLAEYLRDMANRDRREVKSRLVVVIAHLLKWEYQPETRSRSWRTTVLTQSQRLADLAGQGVLQAHARAILPEAYDRAVRLAESETGLPRATFPERCPFTLEQILAVELSMG